MKTTIRLPDALVREAKRIAARESTTVRSLVERGLRRELAARKRRVAFRLHKVTFRGDGLKPGVTWSWDCVAPLAYEGHGG